MFSTLKRQALTALAIMALSWSNLSIAAIDVDINGVEGDVADNIRLHLGSWRELPGSDAEAIGDEIDGDVQKALQAMGYYNANVKYQLDGEKVIISIEPGDPIVWQKADIQILQEGEQAPEFVELKNNNPFKTGEKLSHEAYENYKRRILNLASELGYLDAQIQKSQLRINPKAGNANVVLIVELKQRYKVGDINLVNTQISRRLSDQIIDVETGDWFSANSVGEIYNDLLNSGYFSAINITIDKKPPSTANLNIDMVDSPEHRVETGVGYGTDTGPRFKLTWERPHTNSRGNSQNNELLLSEVEQSVASRYRIPTPHPQNRYLSWDTGYQRKLIEDTLTQVATTGLVFHLLRDSGWQYSAGVDLKHERNKVDDEPEPDVTYVIPAVQASKRSIWGEPSDPRFVYKYWINLAHGTEINADTTFLKMKVGINTLITLGEKHSLVSRFEGGGIKFEADDFSSVPLSQRFFIGGDQTVRGYDYETISPLDEEGELIGGQYYSAASIEYRYRFLPSWQAALFLDGGRSYIDDDEFCIACEDNGVEYRSSAGFGVRWLSPVGFIAADIAFPLTAVGNDEKPAGPNFHLYLGTQL